MHLFPFLLAIASFWPSFCAACECTQSNEQDQSFKDAIIIVRGKVISAEIGYSDDRIISIIRMKLRVEKSWKNRSGNEIWITFLRNTRCATYDLRIGQRAYVYATKPDAHMMTHFSAATMPVYLVETVCTHRVVTDEHLKFFENENQLLDELTLKENL